MLLEVIVSLAILGFAVAALMRSFTQSMAAAKTMQVQTQAMFFARQVMQEMEIQPPDTGKQTGGFGDDYRNYSFYLEVRYTEPKYHGLKKTDVEQFFPMREVYLEIRYDDGVHKPYAPLKLSTAVIGFEKFSTESKRSYMNF